MYQAVVKSLSHTELTVTVLSPSRRRISSEIELIGISIRNGDGSAEVVGQIPMELVHLVALLVKEIGWSRMKVVCQMHGLKMRK